MIIEGKFTVKAPIQKLWDMLLEPETLARCLPGAEKIEKIDEKTYDAVVKQKVGPIKVKLAFQECPHRGAAAHPPGAGRRGRRRDEARPHQAEDDRRPERDLATAM